jgi:hypothetical protein
VSHTSLTFRLFHTHVYKCNLFIVKKNKNIKKKCFFFKKIFRDVISRQISKTKGQAPRRKNFGPKFRNKLIVKSSGGNFKEFSVKIGRFLRDERRGRGPRKAMPDRVRHDCATGAVQGGPATGCGVTMQLAGVTA